MDKNASEELKVREGIMAAVNREIEKRKKEPKLIIYDFLYFILNFIFARFHKVVHTHQPIVHLVSD